MEYFIIVVCIIAVIAVGVILDLKIKRDENMSDISDTVAVNPIMRILPNFGASNKPAIKMDTLPVEVFENYACPVEITDKRAIAHIDNLIPGLLQAGNAANNALQAVKSNGKVLYEVIIPPGEVLAKSTKTEGALRGIYKGADGKIKGHAEWIPVKSKNGKTIATNATSAVMGIAALIVGQYYMKEINGKLSNIDNKVSDIKDFLDTEYNSKVMALISSVKKISDLDYLSEITDNEQLRQTELISLKSMERDCMELLGQANLMLGKSADKTNLNYKEYKNELAQVQRWLNCQRYLFDILNIISELIYTLQLGTVSREKCLSSLNDYTKQVESTQAKLIMWHEDAAKRLEINTDKYYRRKEGWDAVWGCIPGLFDDELNYRRMSSTTVDMIKNQKQKYENIFKPDTSELYRKKMQLVSKDGKLYYLP